jgi:signal peptidase I
VTASTLPTDPLPATPTRPASSRLRRAAATAGALALPAIAALLIVRFLLPSPLEGAPGGLAGVLSTLGDRYPLFVGLALFLALSEAGRYWWRHLHRDLPADVSLVSGQPVRRLLAVVAIVAALVFVIRGSLVSTARVVGPSMLPTLVMGDRVLVNRLAYGVGLPLSRARLGQKTPERGDLVVFRSEGRTAADAPQSIVKRVIGVPGDRVSIAAGIININGWPVPICDAGPYVAEDHGLIYRGRLTVEFLGDRAYLTVRTPMDRAFNGYLVQPGEVFVLGDDRGVSNDSRAWSDRQGAGVPIRALEGRVSRVLFGARPDHRLDFARLFAKPLDLKLWIPGIDMGKTDERIGQCLKNRPAQTFPPSMSN